MSTTTVHRPPTTEPAARASGRAPNGKNGLGVFGSNRSRPFHRWYPFVEGYSSELVERALKESSVDGLVLDPFGGSGTTALTAAMLGRDAVYAEVNPYLAWIADVKINQSRLVAESSSATAELRELSNEMRGTLPAVNLDHPLISANARRGFFGDQVAIEILGLLALIDHALAGATREVARLAVATSLVPASNMIRRTDLRRRVSNDPPPANLRDTVIARMNECADDIDLYGSSIKGGARRVASDIRGDWSEDPRIAVVVTSPPYLNGTNYCRNTKLELLALGFIASEDGLKDLRSAEISAGINAVSRRRKTVDAIDCVEDIAVQLDAVAYDARIPVLVRTYFADMKRALEQVKAHAIPGARMYFDIGDSRYSKVHVPTHHLLRKIAEDVGWRFLDEEVLRRRRSYDGFELTQVLLQFEA